MSQKQWMWQDENSGGVQAVIVDFDTETVLWFDEPGCACAGNDAEQSISDFLERGSSKLMPPDDILQEMRTALQNQG